MPPEEVPAINTEHAEARDGQVEKPTADELKPPAQKIDPPAMKVELSIPPLNGKLMPLRMAPGLPRLAQDQILLVMQAEELIRTKQLELARRPHTDGELSPLQRTPAKSIRNMK